MFKVGDLLKAKEAKDDQHSFVVLETPETSPYNCYRIFSIIRDTSYTIKSDVAERMYIVQDASKKSS